MRVLGFDLETTGLEIGKDHVTEIAWAIWDTELKQFILTESFFLKIPDDVEVTEEITQITGITKPMLEEFGVEMTWATHELLMQMSTYRVDRLVAHNGVGFDRPFLNAQLERYGLVKAAARLDKMPLIDTRTDLPLKGFHKSMSLSHLAADHGFLNPFPHRALFDVVTMLKLLSFYDIDEVCQISDSPSVKLIANVHYDNRKLAQDARFRWNPEARKWEKVVKKCFLERETKNLGFEYQVVDV